MTDPTEPQTPEPEESPIGEVYEQLTAAERATAIGAGMVLVTWLVGQVLVHHYTIDDVALPIAAGILFGIYSFFKADRAAWHALYPWLIAVAALAVALLGLNRFLEDLRFSFPGATSWIWRITYYTASGLLAYGGTQLLRDR